MKRFGNKPLFMFLCILSLVLLLAGCTLVPKQKAAAPELIDPVSVELDVFEVRRGTLTIAINGIGIVVPSATDYQSFEIDGELSEAFVKQGDVVQKGDVLFRLDSSNFDMQLVQQQLAVENRQRSLAQLLEAAFDEDNVNDIWLQQTNLKIEQMKLDLLLDRQSKRTLTAASDGIVSFVDNIPTGGQITSYRPLVGIAQTDKLQLRYIGDISPHLINIKLGMPAELNYQDILLQAQVAGIPSSKANESNPMRAAIAEKTLLFDFVNVRPDSFQPGDHIEFKMELVRKENTLIIPRGALRNFQGRDYVMVIDGEVRREVDVKRGLATPTEIEIVAGLTEGQQVVVTK